MFTRKTFSFSVAFVMVFLFLFGCENTPPVQADQSSTSNMASLVKGIGLHPYTEYPVVVEQMASRDWDILIKECPGNYDTECFQEDEAFGGQYIDTGRLNYRETVEYIQNMADQLGVSDHFDYLPADPTGLTEATIATSVTGGIDLGNGAMNLDNDPPLFPSIDASFESWPSYMPDTWNDETWQGSGTWDVPSTWALGNYFPTSNLTQSTDQLVGNYSLDLQSHAYNDVVASVWYMIPAQYQIDGVNWYCAIGFKGSTGRTRFSIQAAFYDASGSLIDISSAVFVGNNTSTYQYAVTDGDPVYSAVSPVYVRVAVIQTTGVTSLYNLELDDVHVFNPGDVSLPVSLISLTGEYDYSNYEVVSEFETGSETNNDYFELYYQKSDGTWAGASGYHEPGAGSVPYGTTYNVDWPVNAAVVNLWNSLSSGQKIKFCLGSTDYDGTKHVYNDPPADVDWVIETTKA